MFIVRRMMTFFLQKPLEFPWDLASNWECKAPDNSKQCTRAFWKQATLTNMPKFSAFYAVPVGYM